QHEAGGGEAPRQMQGEREHAARTGKRDRTEAYAEAGLHLRDEGVVAERGDAAALAARLGPYDGGAIAGERENGERAGGKKMLDGASLVRQLMRDGRDQAELGIAPARDPDAGLAAQRRAPAVGCDE